MKQYELVLKNEKGRYYDLISWIIVSGNVVSLLLIAIADYKNTGGPALIILLFWFFLIAGAAILTFVKIGFQKYGRWSLMGPIFWLSFPWLATQYKWMFVLDILFFVLKIITTRKLIVTIGNDIIIYPAFPKKKIQWPELSNLILKDGLLTIDFKNDKLMQHTINEIATPVDEKEFNDFCQQQLNK